MATLFISDVHLSARRPEIVGAFEAFLSQEARQAEAVYMLGDVFDEWLGDDDRREPHPRVIRAIGDLAESGVPVFMMHGNHDFLMGAEFEKASGCALIDDPTVIELYGCRVLLMHGDILCTRDVEYQKFREMAQDPENQRQFLTLPMEQRAARAAALREQSREAMRLRPEDIMDVTPEAVVSAMSAHGVRHFVHGHTHRPDVHALEVDGEPAVRIVLGDWYEHDSVLVWDQQGYRLGRISDIPS